MLSQLITWYLAELNPFNRHKQTVTLCSEQLPPKNPEGRKSLSTSESVSSLLPRFELCTREDFSCFILKLRVP